MSEDFIATRFANYVTIRAYIWDEGKLRQITAKQVLRHRALIIESVGNPKCLVDVMIVDAWARHAATMGVQQINCYCAHVRF